MPERLDVQHECFIDYVEVCSKKDIAGNLFKIEKSSPIQIRYNIITIRFDKNPISGKCLSVIHKTYFLMQGLILTLIFCDM